MGTLVLVLGGARSGKSAFAATFARGARRVTFVATAERGDQEMRRKIAAHRRSRPRGWWTVEEPTNVPAAVAGANSDVVIVDCLSLWVSNLMPDSGRLPVREQPVLARVRGLVRAARRHRGTVVIVSNEVGMGIVPAAPLGRVYRDLLGRANQLVAAAADHVYLLVAGIAVEVRQWAGR